METCSVVLTFESVDKILWCDHSIETSLAGLLHCTISFSIFEKLKFGIFLVFQFLALLGVKKKNKPLLLSFLCYKYVFWPAFQIDGEFW